MQYHRWTLFDRLSEFNVNFGCNAYEKPHILHSAAYVRIFIRRKNNRFIEIEWAHTIYSKILITYSQNIVYDIRSTGGTDTFGHILLNVNPIISASKSFKSNAKLYHLRWCMALFFHSATEFSWRRVQFVIAVDNNHQTTAVSSEISKKMAKIQCKCIPSVVYACDSICTKLHRCKRT